MKCPNCNSDNDISSVFCSECGARLNESAETDAVAEAYGVTSEGRDGNGNIINLPTMDFGDIISETFSIYRQHFYRFYNIAFIPQIPLLIIGFILSNIAGSVDFVNKDEFGTQ